MIEDSRHEGDDDEAAFRAAMEDVEPIAKGRQTELKPQSDDALTQQLRREAAVGLTKDSVDPNFLTLGEVQPVAPLEHLEWKKDGVQQAVFDKLRRGGYEIQQSLDLHRKTVKEARELVFKFLARASAADQRSLLISPGKGEMSETPGRLKSFVAHWLTEHPEVIAFCSAQRHHGGVGSLYVLVRKSPVGKELNREQHGLKSGE